ncbi:MAG: hypothetical protein NVSMB23_06710 [Myxococcales bacterium]
MPGEDGQPASGRDAGPIRAELAQAAAELRAWLAWSSDGGLRAFAAGRPVLPAPPAPAPVARAHPPEGDAMPPASSKVNLPTLQAVRADLGECTRCKLHRGRNRIVFGAGSDRARLVFVGEAPGEDEDLSGEPFVGKAGQLLTKMIEAMGLRRDDVYICNTVKCRPPNNRNPEPDELGACEPFLKGQLAALRAEAIVTLGKFAAQALLRDAAPISRMRGSWREYEGVPLMPTFHPAYLLRSPGEKGKVWSDLQQVMKKLGLKDRAGSGP